MKANSFLDLSGNTYGKLSVVGLHSKSADKRLSFWDCECECGTKKVVRGDSLKSGKSRSCGCLSVAIATSHGMHGTPFYKAWVSMKQRCLNEKCPSYSNYGGRGITVCRRWVKFENFHKDMYPTYAKGLQLDRKNNNGNYTPSNCRWVTSSENSKNRRNSSDVQSSHPYVSYSKKSRKWTLALRFNTEEEAVSAYERYFGEGDE